MARKKFLTPLAVAMWRENLVRPPFYRQTESSREGLLGAYQPQRITTTNAVVPLFHLTSRTVKRGAISSPPSLACSAGRPSVDFVRATEPSAPRRGESPGRRGPFPYRRGLGPPR